MARPLVLEFTKMHGAGNDFVVVDNRFYVFSDEELVRLARRLCVRRFGIGADGLLALSAPHDAEHAYRMRYVNADGSLATMCANGARCLARFARLGGLGHDVFVFESDAGLYRAEVPADPSAPVRLVVTSPRDFQADLPLSQAYGEDHRVETVHYVWTGTEHVVVFVGDVEAAPVETLGSHLRHDAALQPAGANVNFVEVAGVAPEGGEVALRVRTFEKGVEAETLACGTGALASAVVAQRLGRVGTNRVAVHMPGGVLTAGVGAEETYLEGPALVVYRGSVELDPSDL